MANSPARVSAPVAVARTNPLRVAQDVARAMELADWKRYVSRGTDIALKPNLGWDKLIPGAVSAPWVVEAVIEVIRGYVGAIYMVESDQVVVSADRALALTGLAAVCRRTGVTWVNMSHGRFVSCDDPRRLVLKSIRIPEILTRTELISLSLLKTHNKTQLSGALKNQWGCLETLRHNFHLVLPEALVDINTILAPRFAVMDGTVALEGDGPKSGIPKEMNVILASANLVGVDATAARLMALAPESLRHVMLCAEHGLGTVPLPSETVGDDVGSIVTPFRPARHNAVSWLELSLRRSHVERVVFGTGLLDLACWGARRYYDVWDFTVGRRLRSRFFATSGYAAQWR